MRALILTDNTIILERLAHLFGGGINFRPCRRDEQCRFALLYGGYIRIGGTLIKCWRMTTIIICGNFSHRAEFDELGKRLVSLFGGGKFNDLSERGGFLAADGRQLGE